MWMPFHLHIQDSPLPISSLSSSFPHFRRGCGAQIPFKMEVEGGVSMRIEFGFDDPKFSDRILRIQSTGDSHHQHCNDSSTASATALCRVKTVHICSLVLASQSPFFHKMFSNGMRESEQQAVTISVNASEEMAMLDILRFMYSNTLNANTSDDLLRVIILADRFQVVTCIAHCAQRLSELAMTFELAASCINLPSSVFEGGSSHLKSLFDKATCFISKNFGSHIGVALKLPLEAIEKLMSWDALEVNCEDEVYDFLIDWAKTHYEDASERCRVFSSQLFPLVRLPYMSSGKIKSISQCEELEPCDASMRVMIEALLSKYANHPSTDVAACLAQERAYKLKPVQVTVLDDSPYPECIVHTKLTKDECATLAEGSVIIRTQNFHVGNESFYLKFYRLSEDRSRLREFAITVRRCWNISGTEAQKLDYDISVRMKTDGKFKVEVTGSFALLKEGGCYFQIGKSWDSFISNDSQYFINDVLYVRFTIRLQ